MALKLIYLLFSTHSDADWGFGVDSKPVWNCDTSHLPGSTANVNRPDMQASLTENAMTDSEQVHGKRQLIMDEAEMTKLLARSLDPV